MRLLAPVHLMRLLLLLLLLQHRRLGHPRLCLAVLQRAR
jgi:hypothetical protein